MLYLNEEQQDAVTGRKDAPLQLMDPRNKQVYVLIGQEEYDSIRKLLDDQPADVRQLYPIMARVFGPAGWDDPEMDIYDELDPRRSS